MESKWSNELKNLSDGEMMNFWKPEEGSHTVKFLNDGEERQVEIEDKGKTKILNKVNFKVVVNEENYVFSVSKGSSHQSLYGQIAEIGAEKGSLVGVTLTVLVKGNGMSRSYVILEAVGLSAKNKVKQEKIK